MRTALAIALLLGTAAANAAEPSGCDKFKWPVEAERSALTTSQRPLITSGSGLMKIGSAATVALVPSAEAKLPTPSERSFPPDTFGGVVTVAAPQEAGLYMVSLSDDVWVDVVQDGKLLKPVGFSGATGCAGIRKTLRFELMVQPVVVQFSGGKADRVNLLLSHPHTPTH